MRAHALRIEQAERAFEHRAELVAGLQHVDGMDLHQRLQPLGERGLAAADRAQQVEDLLALLEALRGVAEEADDPLDRLFHAVEFGERRIDPDGAVHEDAAEARVLRGVDHLRLADRGQQALGRGRVHHRIVAAAPRDIRAASSPPRGAPGRSWRKLRKDHQADTSKLLMQDGCKRNMLSGCHVNVFSPGREVSKPCVAGFTCTIRKFSCPGWRRRYKDRAERGDGVAAHRDVQSQHHDSPGRVPPSQAGTPSTRPGATFSKRFPTQQYKALEPWQ